MSVKKTVSIKTIFLVNFASIILFCLLVLAAFFGYRQVVKFINGKNYQQCLNEQGQANKDALSYVPAIKQVSLDKQGKVLVKGSFISSNVEKFDVTFDSDDKCWNKNISFNKVNGNFTITVTPNYNDSECSSHNFYRGGVKLNFKIASKDDSVVCKGASKNASSSTVVTTFCNLNNLEMVTSFIDNKWCMYGWVDVGLGSAPIWELSDNELQTIGLSKNNICYHSQESWRKDKCVNKNSTNFLHLF